MSVAGALEIARAQRLPPHDLDAERVVVSAAMLDPECFATLSGKIEARHFYSESHRRIFEAVAELTHAGRLVDAVAVAGWLRDRDRLAQVGGAAYLAELIDAVPATSYLEQHAERVIGFCRVRELIAATQTIAAQGYAVRADEAQAFLDESESKIFELAQRDERRDIAGMDVIVRESYDRMIQAETRGEVELPTGLRELDEKIGGLGRGRVTVIAARPGMGKTSLATGAAEHIARLDAGPVAIFSLEMPRAELGVRMACAKSRASVHRALNGRMFPDERDRVIAAQNELFNLPIWIDDTAAATLMQIRSKARMVSAKARRRLALVVVDYLQLVKGHASERASRDRELSMITAGMKQLAKELQCAVVLLSQLNRDCESEKDKRPRLSNLRESGGIEQDADDVIFVYRDDYYHADTKDKGIAELIVAKQRNGPTGAVSVRFDGASTSFTNLEAQ